MAPKRGSKLVRRRPGINQGMDQPNHDDARLMAAVIIDQETAMHALRIMLRDARADLARQRAADVTETEPVAGLIWEAGT